MALSSRTPERKGFRARSGPAAVGIRDGRDSRSGLSATGPDLARSSPLQVEGQNGLGARRRRLRRASRRCGDRSQGDERRVLRPGRAASRVSGSNAFTTQREGDARLEEHVPAAGDVASKRARLPPLHRSAPRTSACVPSVGRMGPVSPADPYARSRPDRAHDGCRDPGVEDSYPRTRSVRLRDHRTKPRAHATQTRATTRGRRQHVGSWQPRQLQFDCAVSVSKSSTATAPGRLANVRERRASPATARLGSPPSLDHSCRPCVVPQTVDFTSSRDRCGSSTVPPASPTSTMSLPRSSGIGVARVVRFEAADGDPIVAERDEVLRVRPVARAVLCDAGLRGSAPLPLPRRGRGG